jgi:cholesterol transport system auxiliary component
VTRSTLAALAPFVLLSGCLGFGGKPPAYQLTLTPTSPPPVGQVQTAAITAPGQTVALHAGGQTTTLAAAVPPAAGSASLTIESFSAPAEIAVNRVPVDDGGHITYIKGGQWVEPPARLFARLIGDTVTTRTGRVVLSTAQSFATGSARLTGEVRRFGIDDAGGPAAVVTLDATLIRAREGGAIEKQRFEARVPVSSIDAASAGAALNTAANQVAQQVADWVGR